MKLARWHLYVVGLALVLLVGLWFKANRRPESTDQPESATPAGHTLSDPAHSMAPSPPTTNYDPDCPTCPPNPYLSEAVKRSGSTMEDTEKCWEILTMAAAEGNPDPDTSHLGHCFETPIFHAYTADQVQALLDAGVDLNVHGEFGHTPLYRHMHRAVIRPTEETHAIVEKLLEGGADPWLRNTDGELPYEVARRMNTSGTTRIQGEEFLRSKLEQDGITEEQAFAQRPEFAEAMRQMRRAPEIASRTIASLMNAMKRTDPNRNPQ